MIIPTERIVNLLILNFFRSTLIFLLYTIHLLRSWGDRWRGERVEIGYEDTFLLDSRFRGNDGGGLSTSVGVCACT